MHVRSLRYCRITAVFYPTVDLNWKIITWGLHSTIIFDLQVLQYTCAFITVLNQVLARTFNCIMCVFRILYRMSQEECARIREGVPYIKVYRYNPKHLCPKLNGYGDKGARKVWSSCGFTYCTWFAWRSTHTLRIVRPCLQLAQARSSLRLHM